MRDKLKIKFSHYYPKLPENCDKATLIQIFMVKQSEKLSKHFVEYDTKYYDDQDRYYKLPNGKVLILLFLAVDGTLFTTIRRWTPNKETYYNNNIGHDFKIVVLDS